jgi:hypothetical protein
LPVALEALARELAEAREAGELGFYARVMAQVTLPHSRPADNEYVRRNGDLTLSMWAPAEVGLPYASVPRLLLAWLTTEAVRTRERRLVLGNTLAAFMRELDLVPTGGRWGTIPRLRTQMERLFASSMVCTYRTAEVSAQAKLDVAVESELWWNPRRPEEAVLWNSTVLLGERFFDEVTRRPVPIDMAALRTLRRSPLALDLYVWLTHRFSYLRQGTTVPWEALQMQFGSDYNRLDNFQAKVRRALTDVVRVYPGARVSLSGAGLQLTPSPTHVRRLK